MSSENFEKAKFFFLKGLNFFQGENYDLAEKNLLESLKLLPQRMSTIHNLISIYIVTNQKKKIKGIIGKQCSL